MTSWAATYIFFTCGKHVPVQEYNYTEKDINGMQLVSFILV